MMEHIEFELYNITREYNLENNISAVSNILKVCHTCCQSLRFRALFLKMGTIACLPLIMTNFIAAVHQINADFDITF